MKLLAYLNTEEQGCKYSKHFIENWMKNPNLHPELKKIKVDDRPTKGQPSLTLLDDDGETILHYFNSDIGRLDLIEREIKIHLNI